MGRQKRNRKVNINLEEHRPEGATSWELPPWGHVLSCGVYPFFMVIDDQLIPMGTAFCISKPGLVATATHNLTEAFKYHPRGERMLRENRFPKKMHLREIGDPGFSVLHSYVPEPNRLQINVWPLESASGFAIDAEVENGQSGGPVFNEEGFVCGVVSAGATGYFGEPASLTSLLYPALAIGIQFGFQQGPSAVRSHPSALCAG